MAARLLKRQEPGSPAYNCHNTCGEFSCLHLGRACIFCFFRRLTSHLPQTGQAIRQGRFSGDARCSNDVFKTNYANCLKCSGPDNANIWSMYGRTLENYGRACGLSTTPASGKQDAIPEALPAVDPAASPASSPATTAPPQTAAPATTGRASTPSGSASSTASGPRGNSSTPTVRHKPRRLLLSSVTRLVVVNLEAVKLTFIRTTVQAFSSARPGRRSELHPQRRDGSRCLWCRFCRSPCALRIWFGMEKKQAFKTG